MTEHLIDLKALLVERPDCDAGTVQQLRNALAQGGTQFRTLRDVTEMMEKKLETLLRRKIEEKQSGQARTGAGDRIPEGYSDAVAEYFRRLSKGR